MSLDLNEALVRLRLGDAPAALLPAERAVALAPGNADAHAALAEIRHALGDREAAVASHRAALELAPERADLWSNLGSTLLELGRGEDAREAFRKALDLAPGHAAVRNNLGDALRRAGLTTEALAQLREAARLDPRSAVVRVNLSRVLADLGESAESLAQAIEAARLSPNRADVWIHLGRTLQILARSGEAAEAFREAIRLRPLDADAHAALGALLEEFGDLDEARAAYRKAVELDPGHGVALGLLATRLRDRLEDENVARCEHVWKNPSATIERRRAAAFGLAQVLEARGAFAESDAVAADANRLRRLELAEAGRAYRPEAHSEFVDRIIAGFDSSYFQKIKGYGDLSERPVFVVGLPRSGTSLVEQILASHPAVFGAGELTDVDAMLMRLTNGGADVVVGLRGLAPEVASNLAKSRLDRLAALDATALRAVDKMPENTHSLGLIATLFPNARIIHCRRDLRDVAFSCWTTDFSRVRWACDMEEMASHFEAHLRLMDHWRRTLPVPMLEVDYEDLVADVETVSRRMIAHLGLDWNDACLNFHETKRPVRTASAPQVRRPIYAASVGRWKNHRAVLGPLCERLNLEN